MKVFLSMLLFILMSCVNSEKISIREENLESKLIEEWIYTTKIDGPFNEGKIIDKPVGFEQYVMKLVVLDVGGANFKTHCVYYKVPYKNMLGILKIQELKNEEKCPQNSSENLWAEVSGIENFNPRIENFKLILEFDKNKKKTLWSIPLVNISAGIIHEKYQSAQEKKLYPLLTILRTTEGNTSLLDSYYIGRISDSFSNGQMKRCYQVNKECAQVGEDLCDRCRYGYFEVVDYNCPKGGSRFCGQNHCGEKNEPACPRGSKLAVEDSDLGICQNDLTAVRNSDHILICQ